MKNIFIGLDPGKQGFITVYDPNKDQYNFYPVIRNVVSNFENTNLMITYLFGSVIGSISMHYIAMKYFEKPKKNKN